MSEVEDRLGQLLHAAAPPSAGVPFEQVRRQVRRRRAARWSVAASAVVAAVVGVGVASLSPSSTTRRPEQAAATPSSTASPSSEATPSVDLSGAVPWVDDPAQPYQAPPAPTPTADARPTGHARACTAADVAVRVEHRNGATGQTEYPLTFRNTSTSTCVLSGYPHVVASEPGRPSVSATAGSFFDFGSTANMAPGQVTGLGVETDTECAARPGGANPGPPYHRLTVTLPGGGTVSVNEPDGFDVACGLKVTHFFVDLPSDPAPAHDPLSDLTVGLQLPASVRAGGTLVYVAELTNPTEQPVSLDRWPSYVETTTGPVPAEAAYQLNCGPVGVIPARGTVRFAMRLTIPATAPAGPLTLRWELAIVPGLPPTAQATVTVTSPTASSSG